MPSKTDPPGVVPIARHHRRGSHEGESYGPAIKSDLAEALAVIQSNHIDGRKLDYNAVFKSSISGMLSVLDPHSTYFDPAEYASFRTEQRSEYFGIGATIEDFATARKSTLTFAPPSRNRLPLAPACDWRSHYGHRRQLDEGKTYPEVRKFLLGPRGTTVKVTVEHEATKQSETVSIVRDAVSLPSISQAYMLKQGVGYVAMTGGFNLTSTRITSDQLLKKINCTGRLEPNPNTYLKRSSNALRALEGA